MSKVLFTILTSVLFLTGCEELSFGGQQQTNSESEKSDNDSNSDNNLGIDLTDKTELSCTGSYPIRISAIENLSSSDAKENLAKLTDKNKTNAFSWESHAQTTDLIFQVDKKALIKDFVISWKNQELSHYFNLDVSFDKEQWDNVIINAQSQQSSIIAERLSINGNAKTAYFIRLRLNGNNTDDFSDISEFEVFGCYQDTSHDIELIDWYLSVQTDVDGNGKSDSIKETDLQNGYEDPRFFYISEDRGLVFSSTVQGYRTSTNTKYVRSELREMLRRGNSVHKTQGVNKNNWVFSSAPSADLENAGGIDGTLNATLAVNHVTSTGEEYQIGRVIIGQIHANDDEPVRLYYRKLPMNDKGSIYIAHEYLDGDDHYYEIIGSRDNDAEEPANGIALGEKFDYTIDVVGNELTVTINKSNGETYSQKVDMTHSGYDIGGQYMYFKAGVYNQNNSGDMHDYVQATFYKINNSHVNY